MSKGSILPYFVIFAVRDYRARRNSSFIAGRIQALNLTVAIFAPKASPGKSSLKNTNGCILERSLLSVISVEKVSRRGLPYGFTKGRILVKDLTFVGFAVKDIYRKV